MMQSTTDTETEEKQALTSEPEAKWGDAIKGGYQVLPNALLKGQHLLKLSPTDMIVIANMPDNE